METKTNIKIKQKRISSDKNLSECPISNASTEIMLHRVCNGYKVEFPFSN